MLKEGVRCENALSLARSVGSGIGIALRWDAVVTCDVVGVK